MPEEQTVDLNPRFVIVPLMRCLHEAMDVTKIALKAVDTAEFAESVEVSGSKFAWIFHGGVRSNDEKRAAYEDWLLSKGLQELARGVRETLEHAYLFCALIEHFNEMGNRSKWHDVRELLRKKRRDANDLRFPDLMREVSKKTTTPVDFTDQFLSLQNVRNVLEHRGGRVTPDKADKNTGLLVLSWPKFKLYYEKNGEEVEVAPGTVVDSGGPEDTVQIMGRLAVEDREFKVGEQIVFKRAEFYDIAWGCWLFAERLVGRLPVIEAVPS